MTGNAALVAAAAQVIHDNAADVGGNNIPVTGGTYNPDGLTLADVLSTAAPAPAVVAATRCSLPAHTCACDAAGRCRARSGGRRSGRIRSGGAQNRVGGQSTETPDFSITPS